jgi:hypothetical protein
MKAGSVAHARHGGSVWPFGAFLAALAFFHWSEFMLTDLFNYKLLEVACAYDDGVCAVLSPSVLERACMR